MNERRENIPYRGMIMLGLILQGACTTSSVPNIPTNHSACSAPLWPENDRPQDNVISRDVAIRSIRTALNDRGISDANNWGKRIVEAMERAGYPLTYSKLALVLALIEQESGFDWDPLVYENLGAKIATKKAQYENEHPDLVTWINSTDDGQKLSEFIDEKGEAASAARTEGELVQMLHEDLEQFEREFPVTVGLLDTAMPSWRFEALSQVSTFGPMQVGVLSTFTPEERATMTWEKYAGRQDLFVEQPTEALEAGIRYVMDLQDYYGNCAGCVIHDYKGGAFAHLNAQFQMMLRLADPDLVVDGDLLAFDRTIGVPLEDVSSTERVARRFNQKYKLGYSDEEIREALKKRGRDFVDDCFVRSVAAEYMKTHDVMEPPRTTLNIRKGRGEKGETAKDRETVTKYVERVIGRYQDWLKLLNHVPAPSVARAAKKDETMVTKSSSSERKVEKMPAPKEEPSKPASLFDFTDWARSVVEKYPNCPHALSVDVEYSFAKPVTKIMFQNLGDWIIFKVTQNAEGEVRVMWEEHIARKDNHGVVRVVSLGRASSWVESKIEYQCDGSSTQLKPIDPKAYY